MARRTHFREFLGTFLIVIGAIWAIKTMHIFSYEFEYLYLSWPVFLMALGCFLIIRSRGNFGGFVLIFIGGAYFLSRMFDLSVGEIFSNFWPLLLIGVGISILLEYWRGKPKKTKSGQETVTDDFIEVSGVLSDENLNVESQNLTGIKVSTMLGGVKINLFGAKPVKDCIIDLEILMGGVELFIPSHWKVRNDVSTLFGGVEESRRRSVPLEGTEQPEITIKGSVLFGGLEIKS